MTPAERAVLRRIVRIRPIPPLLAKKNPISKALLWFVCLFSEDMMASKRRMERCERFLALPIEIKPMHPTSGCFPYRDYVYVNTKEEAGLTQEEKRTEEACDT